MSNSSLATYTQLSPNYNSGRINSKYNPTGKITKITIHHAACKVTSKQLCNIFAPTSRNASANYCIGYEGDIALCVDEANRAWTSSSAANDYNAITIEVANNSGSPDWTVSDASLKSLIALCIDICKRNDIKQLNWTGDKTGNVTCHYMFEATACPGPYLKSKIPYIVEQVNAALLPVEAPTTPNTGLTAGTSITLNNTNLYAASSSTRRSATKTGTFYIWSAEVVSGRIRITNSAGNVGKSGQVTGWINISDIPQVKTESNTPVAPSVPTKKSNEEIAKEVWEGKWGNGEDRKTRLTAAGYDYNAIQALVQKQAQPQAAASVSIKNGDIVKFKASATKWSSGETIPNWVKSKILYVRTNPSNNVCCVSTVKTGSITGKAKVSDLIKV